MGQGASGLPGAPGGGPPGGPGGDKKDDKKKKKFEPRPPLRTGKKKRKKGPSAAVRTPQGAMPPPCVLIHLEYSSTSASTLEVSVLHTGNNQEPRTCVSEYLVHWTV